MRRTALARNASGLALAGLGVALASWALHHGAVAPAAAQPGDATAAAPSTGAPAPSPQPGAPAARAASWRRPPPIGERFDDDAALPLHADPVASYELSVRLDPRSHDLVGSGIIRWRNASSIAQRELWLHLYLNAFKNERTVFLRNPRGGFRGSSALSDWGRVEVERLFARELGVDLWPVAARTSPGDAEDETDIAVPLPQPVAPGASLTLEVAWRAHLPSLTLRTGHWGAFHMVGQWFPKLARLEQDGSWSHFPFHPLSEFYADFGRYDVTVDVPDGVKVAATGAVAGETRAEGRVATRFVQDDVHDFAFAAWDGFAVQRTEHEGVVIACYYPPGFERAAEVEIDTVKFGLSYLGRAFGRYPYGTLTVVHPPPGAEEAGGMEYPTLITTGGAWTAPWSGIRSIENVTIHELGHQWFYGLVATNEHLFPFLDEGVNSWAELDSMGARYAEASASSLLGVPIGLPTLFRVSQLRADRSAVTARSSAEFSRGVDYGALVYGRTATALATVGNVWGHDALRRAVGRYARRYRFEHPGPDALLGAVDEVIGPDAAAALASSLLEGGFVDFVAADPTSAPVAADAAPVGADAGPPGAAAAPGAPLHRGQVLVRRLGTVVVPVDVDLWGEDGSVQRVRWDARDGERRLPYQGSSALAAVVVDPEHRVLLDGDLTNNAAVVGRRVPAWRTFEAAIFAAELGALFVSP